MGVRCATCERSLAAMAVYRRRGETFRPGSIMPSTRRHLRGKPVLCGECYRELPPLRKREYARTGEGNRFGVPGGGST